MISLTPCLYTYTYRGRQPLGFLNGIYSFHCCCAQAKQSTMAMATVGWTLYQPTNLLLVEIILTFYALGFTAANSTIRLAIFPLMTAIVCSTVSSNPNEISNSRSLSAAICGGTAGNILQYLDYALLSQWSYEAQGPTSAQSGQHNVKETPATKKRTSKTQNLWGRASFGLFAITASRLPNTPWEVKNTPSFYSDNPNRVPSRFQFLLKSALTLAACLLVLDLSSFSGDNEQNPVLYSWSRVPFFARLEDVSVEEIATRAMATFAMWVVGYCIVQALYCTVSFVCVACGLTAVEAWRPIFGSLTACWSVRSFWGSVFNSQFINTFL